MLYPGSYNELPNEQADPTGIQSDFFRLLEYLSQGATLQNTYCCHGDSFETRSHILLDARAAITVNSIIREQREQRIRQLLEECNKYTHALEEELSDAANCDTPESREQNWCTRDTYHLSLQACDTFRYILLKYVE